jgi:hypothetical protein
MIRLVGALVCTSLVFLMFAACTAEEPRLGSAGDSCQRTEDCAAPLSCVANVCQDKGGDAGTGGGGSGGSGPGADAGPSSACDECLDTLCAAPQAGCDAACVAVEACIEMLCANLSAIGSAEEGDCQTSCQDANPGGKAPHLAVVDCAVSGVCFPPCVPYPQDYEACRVFMNAGDCAGALSACEASPDCNSYRDCVKTCATLVECLACDNTAQGIAGRNLLENYEQCIAAECVTESWLPSFPP